MESDDLSETIQEQDTTELSDPKPVSRGKATRLPGICSIVSLLAGTTWAFQLILSLDSNFS